MLGELPKLEAGDYLKSNVHHFKWMMSVKITRQILPDAGPGCSFSQSTTCGGVSRKTFGGVYGLNSLKSSLMSADPIRSLSASTY
jgi:hypothetical protein